MNQPGLQTAFETALTKYKQDDFDAFESFRVHMENSAIVAQTAVRSHGIMLWFPFLPKDVVDTLTALTSFYHGEAKQMVDLYRKEGQTSSWSSEWQLHEEIVHAAMATATSMDVAPFRVKEFTPFGASEQQLTPIRCFSFLADQFMVSSNILKNAARTLAVCQVGRVYLDSGAALCTPLDGRWENSRKVLTYTCKESTLKLKDKDTVAAIDKPGTLMEDMRFLNEVATEIERIGEAAISDKRLQKIAQGRDTVSELTSKALELAEAIEAKTDKVDVLSTQCGAMALELEELEDGEGGVGRVFGGWRLLKIE